MYINIEEMERSTITVFRTVEYFVYQTKCSNESLILHYNEFLWKHQRIFADFQNKSAFQVELIIFVLCMHKVLYLFETTIHSLLVNHNNNSIWFWLAYFHKCKINNLEAPATQLVQLATCNNNNVCFDILQLIISVHLKCNYGL